MYDPPSLAELVAVVREFIEQRAMPKLEGHTAFHARVAATPGQGRLWASLVPELVGRAAHARAVNLDPAQVILDTLLQIDAAAAEARAHAA